MKHETAKVVLGHYEAALKELVALLDVIKRECPADEHLKYRLTVAQLIGASMEVSNPIHHEHPDLDVHGVTAGSRAAPPLPPSEANATPEEKLEMLCALAADHVALQRKRDSPNEDLFRECFRELAGVGVVAERMPREDNAAARRSAELVLEALTRVAGLVVLLTERVADGSKGETTH